jgi:hypothetical protein
MKKCEIARKEYLIIYQVYLNNANYCLMQKNFLKQFLGYYFKAYIQLKIVLYYN